MQLSTRPFWAPAALVAGLFACQAFAADPTLIYWRWHTTDPNPYFKIRADGVGNTYLGDYPYITDRCSRLSSYPGGRRLFSQIRTGSQVPVPGGIQDTFDLMLFAEDGVAPTVRLTAFNGPDEFVVGGSYRLPVDNRDAFFSFVAWDASNGVKKLYRTRFPLSEVFASASFPPLTVADAQPGGRLELLTTFDWQTTHREWDATGTKANLDVFNANGTVSSLILDTATVPYSTTVVNDAAATGISLRGANFSTTDYLLFCVAETNSGERGLASFRPDTREFKWILKENAKSANTFAGGPKVSPDGKQVAFSMLRFNKGRWAPAVVRIPTSGGNYTVVYALPTSNVNDVGLLGWVNP